MYVCICNGVTDKDIRQAAEAGCRSMAELTMRTGCGATCGTCLDMAAELLGAAQRATRTSTCRWLQPPEPHALVHVAARCERIAFRQPPCDGASIRATTHGART
jgi:bacterioferritin-associated ferredoxin